MTNWKSKYLKYKLKLEKLNAKNKLTTGGGTMMSRMRDEALEFEDIDDYQHLYTDEELEETGTHRYIPDPVPVPAADPAAAVAPAPAVATAPVVDPIPATGGSIYSELY